MSKSLLLKCDTPIDQPTATDQVERATWCELTILVGHRCASRIWDNATSDERQWICVPVFPIAQWIVQNWWSLLNELCAWDTVPTSANDATKMNWLRRHCLRSADSSLMLPALYLYSDGRNVRAEWQSDPPSPTPNTFAEFIDSGEEQLDLNATQESLSQFVNEVLRRAGHVDDERVRALSAQWQAIRSADQDEQQFCILAGRMGIDPYNDREMTGELP